MKKRSRKAASGRGIKRLLLLMLIAAPLLSAEPISMFQEFPAYFSSMPLRHLKTVKVETPFFETVYFGVASCTAKKIRLSTNTPRTEKFSTIRK